MASNIHFDTQTLLKSVDYWQSLSQDSIDSINKEISKEVKKAIIMKIANGVPPQKADFVFNACASAKDLKRKEHTFETLESIKSSFAEAKNKVGQFSK